MSQDKCKDIIIMKIKLIRLLIMDIKEDIMEEIKEVESATILMVIILKVICKHQDLDKDIIQIMVDPILATGKVHTHLLMEDMLINTFDFV